MYYNEISAFDRTPIIKPGVTNIIPEQPKVEFDNQNAINSEILAWCVLGISAIGVYCMILYLDSPFQTDINSSKFSANADKV